MEFLNPVTQKSRFLELTLRTWLSDISTAHARKQHRHRSHTSTHPPWGDKHITRYRAYTSCAHDPSRSPLRAPHTPPRALPLAAHHQHGATALLARLDEAHVLVEAHSSLVRAVDVELDRRRPAAARGARALDELEQRARHALLTTRRIDVELVEEELAAPLGAADGKAEQRAIRRRRPVDREVPPLRVVVERIAVALETCTTLTITLHM